MFYLYLDDDGIPFITRRAVDRENFEFFGLTFIKQSKNIRDIEKWLKKKYKVSRNDIKTYLNKEEIKAMEA